MFKLKLPVFRIILFTLTLLSLSSCKSKLYLSSEKVKQYAISDRITADSTIIKMYLPYKKQMEEKMGEVIGTAPVALPKNTNPESLMGNFFAKALKEIAFKQTQKQADLSFATKFGIRDEIKAGNITLGNVFEIMPFDNTVVILSLTGAQIRKLANFIAKSNGQPVDGLTMEIKNQLPVNIKINGKNIDDQQLYTLVTYDYLANGGDNMVVFTQAKARTNLSVMLRDGLIDYIKDLTKEGQKVTAQLDGRIKNVE